MQEHDAGVHLSIHVPSSGVTYRCYISSKLDVELDSMLATRRSLTSDCRSSVTNSGFNLETTKGERMEIKEKEMKISETYQAALIAAHTIDSAPKSALQGLRQRLSLGFLVCTLVIGAIGTASARGAQDEAAVRALGDTFAKAFIEKNPELRASLFVENGTFVTPVGDFLQGHVAMVKDFGSEAQAVNGSTQAAFSNYKVDFVKPDVAFVDALLTLHNVNGPDGTIIPVIPVNFYYVAVRHNGRWLIADGRAHFAPAPANSMTSRK